MMIVQNELAPATVRNAIVDLMSAQLCGLSIASAYVTVSGSGIIRDSAERYITKREFQRIPKLIVTCFDFGLSEPDALRLWLETPATEVRVAGAAMVAEGSSLRPKQAFHPKAYAFQTNARSANLLVGSANMTGRGFSANTEAVLARRDVPLREIEASFAALSHGTTVLTAELLAEYATLRRRQPPPRALMEMVEAPPEPPAVTIGELRVLRDAIDDGTIDPASFEQMWVQVTRLEGGSTSQVELPRGAQRFFGFGFEGYESTKKETIGSPLLLSGRRTWNDRELTWHGNNRMERINLPTAAQGGFDYANSAVLFRRLSRGRFEMLVAPWEEDLSRSWRAASFARGLVFRLGRSSVRVVGFL